MGSGEGEPAEEEEFLMEAAGVEEVSLMLLNEGRKVFSVLTRLRLGVLPVGIGKL